MSSLPLLLSLLLQVTVPDGPQELTRAADQEHLPLAFVAEVAPLLEVSFHQTPGLAMAYYRPRSVGEGSPAGGTRPALLLYEPYYRSSEHGMKRPLEMTPDVFEYWSHALLLAYLHLRVVDGGGEYGGQLAERAAELYPELEPDAATGLLVTSLAGFGSHVLSLANEIERLVRRRPDRDLCPLIRDGRLHFGAWTTAFESGQYTGVASEPGGEAYPFRPIEAVDKESFVRHVLEGRFQGEAWRDFGVRYCPSVSEAPPADGKRP